MSVFVYPPDSDDGSSPEYFCRSTNVCSYSENTGVPEENVTTPRVELYRYYPREFGEPILCLLKSKCNATKDVVAMRSVIYEDNVKIRQQPLSSQKENRIGKSYSLNHVYETNHTYNYALNLTDNCSSICVSGNTPRQYQRFTGFIIDVAFTSFIVGSGPYVFKLPIESFERFGITPSNVSIPSQFVEVESHPPILSSPYPARLIDVKRVIPKSLPLVIDAVSRYEKQDQTSSSAPKKQVDNKLSSSSKDFMSTDAKLDELNHSIVEAILDRLESLDCYLSNSTWRPKECNPPSPSSIDSYDALSPKASSLECYLESKGIGVVTL